MNGAACFDGSSVIAMPKFANMDFGKTVFMKIRYKQGDLKLETEALLYNGDCDEIPTFVIGTKPSGNSFSVKTNIGLFQTAWVPSSVSSLSYDCHSQAIQSYFGRYHYCASHANPPIPPMTRIMTTNILFLFGFTGNFMSDVTCEAVHANFF